MNRAQTFRGGILLVLLIGGLATGLLIWRALNPIVDHTPIPAATLAAYRPGSPVEDANQAFVAAQFSLGTTRLHAVGDILPYDAQVMRYAEAKAFTIPPGATDYTTYPGDARVWLVLFEGEWQIQSPVPEPTSAKFQPGCVYVILSAQDSSGLGAGGVRECAAYQARTGQQIVKAFLQAKGLDVRPGTRDYGRLMKGILLGGYPELTGPQATLVRNRVELESVLEYVAQHARDGIWYWGLQPTEPELPEALPPVADP